MSGALHYTPREFADATGLGRDTVYGMCSKSVPGICGRPIPCKNAGTVKKPRFLINRRAGDQWWEDECVADAASRMPAVNLAGVKKREA